MKAMLEKKEKGFALIEVMMAALVLTVGCLAFLKLQHKGLQYSFNDYARSQGVAITQGFVEKLRGNMVVVDAYKKCQIFSDTIKCDSTDKPTTTATTTTGTTKPTTPTGIAQKQMKLTQQQMQNSIKGKTVLCYVKKEGHENNRELRLTFMWIDSTANKDAREKGVTDSACPDDYDDDVDDDFIDNSVTIYATI